MMISSKQKKQLFNILQALAWFVFIVSAQALEWLITQG